MIVMNVGGEEIKFATLYDLSKLAGKKSSTLRKMENTGMIPPANFRTPNVMTKDGVRPGARAYTYSMAIQLGKILSNEINKGIAVTEATKSKIRNLFLAERIKYKLDA